MNRFITLFLFVLFFFSCSNSQGNVSKEFSTLKYMADNYEVSTEWSQEMEAEILSGKIKGAQGIASTIKPNANNIFLSGIENQIKPVYPRIPGFASLDLSLLTSEQISFVKKFLDSFIKDEDCSDFFVSSSIPSWIVFNYDWEKMNFKSDSYVIGEPFVCDDFIQIPVRLISADSSVDLWLFLLPSENSFIQIDFFSED